jgi:hypothetical protein
VFVSRCLSYSVIDSGDPLVGVDDHHPSLEVGVTVGDVFKRFPIGRSSAFNFRRCNFVALYHDLNGVDWSFLSACATVECAVSDFYSVLNEVFRCHVPPRGVLEFIRYGSIGT